jgi:hypothetical protein
MIASALVADHQPVQRCPPIVNTVGQCIQLPWLGQINRNTSSAPFSGYCHIAHNILNYLDVPSVNTFQSVYSIGNDNISDFISRKFLRLDLALLPTRRSNWKGSWDQVGSYGHQGGN